MLITASHCLSFQWDGSLCDVYVTCFLYVRIYSRSLFSLHSQAQRHFVIFKISNNVHKTGGGNTLIVTDTFTYLNRYSDTWARRRSSGYHLAYFFPHLPVPLNPHPASFLLLDFLCPLCFLFWHRKGRKHADSLLKGSSMSRLSVSVSLSQQHNTVWVCALYTQGWDFRLQRKWALRSDSGVKRLAEAGAFSSGQVFPAVSVTISPTTDTQDACAVTNTYAA